MIFEEYGRGLLEMLSWYFPGEGEGPEPPQAPVMMTRDVSEVRTQQLAVTGLERYRCTGPLSLCC
jgi:hypothetical protein